MNKIKKVEDKYILECEDGSVFNCELWFEKKTSKWYIKLPKGNPSGRTYITKTFVDGNKDQIYEFETKTEFRSGLSGGGWRNRLTDEEKVQLKEFEEGIERLKRIGMSRRPLTENEKLKNQISKLEEELRELRKLKEKSK